MSTREIGYVNTEKVSKRFANMVAEDIFEVLGDYDLLNERGKNTRRQLWGSGWKARVKK